MLSLDRRLAEAQDAEGRALAELREVILLWTAIIRQRAQYPSRSCVDVKM